MHAQPNPLRLVVPVAPGATPSRPGLASLPRGATVEAEVLEPAGRDTMLLRIAGRRLVATGLSNVDPGTRLRLIVMEPGPPTVLRTAAGSEETAARADSSTTRLPGRQAQQRLLAAAARLIAGPAATRSPDLAQGAARKLLDWPASPERLTDPDGLRDTLLRSGSYFEARLAANKANPAAVLADDWKAALLRVAEGLRRDRRAPGSGPGGTIESSRPPAPESSRGSPALASLVDAALQRITLTQLASRQPAGDTHSWPLAIPVQLESRYGMVEGRIERRSDRGSDEPDTAVWEVELTLELAVLGRLRLRISLAGERVNAVFETENPDASERLAARLPELEDRLLGRGFAVGGLAARASTPQSQPVALAELVDLQA